MDGSSQFVNICCVIVGLVGVVGFSGLALHHENVSMWGVPEPVFLPTIIILFGSGLLLVHGVVAFVRERRRSKLLAFGPSDDGTGKDQTSD